MNNQTNDTTGNDTAIRRGAVDTPPPERYGRRDTNTGAPARGAATYVVAGVIALAIGGGGFAAGYGVAKGTGVTNAASGFGANGSNGGSFMRRGGFGTVTSVSDSSITISETGPGGTASGTAAATKTYTITSATTVTDGSSGSTAAVSDIKTGDTVRVQTASTTSTTATAIEINPTMRGGPGATTQDTTGSGTDATGTGTDSTSATTTSTT